MKLWPPCRLPISTRGFFASLRIIITVAAFFGRTARAPGMRGGPSGLRKTVSDSLIKQLYDCQRRGGKGAFAEACGARHHVSQVWSLRMSDSGDRNVTPHETIDERLLNRVIFFTDAVFAI